MLCSATKCFKLSFLHAQSRHGGGCDSVGDSEGKYSNMVLQPEHIGTVASRA